MIKFSDFLLACDNNEVLRIHNGASTVDTLCETILTEKWVSNYRVIKFWSWSDEPHESYIEVWIGKSYDDI